MANKTQSFSFKSVAKFKAGWATIEPVPDVLYYLSEGGKEGQWYYDPSDTTTPENVGTVIVSNTGGYRFKRRLFGGFVFKSWFTGSNAHFDSVADANSTIGASYRFRSMRVYIMETVIREYWYRDGTADGNLVPLAELLSVTNGPVTFDRKEILTIPNQNEIKAKSLSITGTGNINIIPTVGADTLDFVVDGSGLMAFASGTYSQRPVGILGMRYYQTDILEGTYDRSANGWEYMIGASTLVNERFVSNGLVYYAGSNLVTGSNNQDADSFGRWRIDTGTDPAGGSRIRLSSSMSNFGTTGKIILHVERVSVNALSDGTNRYVLRIGKDVGADVNGMWFEYSHDINGGNWTCVHHNGTTRTATTSGVPVVANTEYTLCIVYELTAGNTSIKYYINNTIVDTHLTNLPSSFVNGFFGAMSIEKTLGTVNRAGFIGPIIIKKT